MAALELLGGGIELVVSPDHGFGTDAFLLADFADPKKTDLVCDLGTGCGIIPLLLRRNGVTGDLYGVDIQEAAIAQFTESVARNTEKFPDGGFDRVYPVLADLKTLADGAAADLPVPLPFGRFKTVIMNPPYKMSGAGILSETAADQIARHETECTIEDVSAAASRLLNFGGKLAICQRPERLTDCMSAFRAHGIEPKRLRFVQKQPDTAPWLFLLSGTLGGKPWLQVDPPLFIQSPDGSDSDELKRILGSYTNEVKEQEKQHE